MTSARDWRGLLFVAPFLLLYSVILIFPLLRGLWLSLNQVDLFGDGHFVGAGNYVRLVNDPVFGASLVNTYEVTLMIVPALTVIALALAGWDSVLARQNRELKDRVEKLENWQKGADARDKAEDAAAERARRKARAARATEGGGADAKPGDKGAGANK